MEVGYVSFPGLGLKFNITQGFTLFGRTIYWYGVIICSAMVLCLLLGLRFCKKYNLSGDDVLDYLIAAVPSAIVGARIYYVIFQWSYYKSNPVSILYVWEGGLAIYGGIIGAAIAIFIMTRVKKHKFLHLLDFGMPYIMLGQAIGRWGNFFNQEAYGAETTSVLGMTGDKIAETMGSSVTVHPTFLYESVWCLLGFIFLAIYRSKLQKNYGEVTALYMIIYGAERALVEGLRTDSLMLNIGSLSVRVSQVLSVVLVIIGIALFIDSKLHGIAVVRTLSGKDAEKAAEAARVEAEGSSIMDVINNMNDVSDESVMNGGEVTSDAEAPAEDETPAEAASDADTQENAESPDEEQSESETPADAETPEGEETPAEDDTQAEPETENTEE